jgi:hypothetical protein
MSPREPALKEADDRLVYVYGVARAEPAEEPAVLPHEGITVGAAVCSLAKGNLVAFVSPVPASQFGASELRAALMNDAWLRDRVLAHEKILEQLRQHRPLIPFRFCSIYRSLAHISQVLQRHQDEINQAIDRVCGASEWGLKLFCEPGVVRGRVEATSNAIGQMRKTIAEATPGTRFFLQKKVDHALTAEVAAAISRRVEQSQCCLGALARESASIPVQERAVHGKSSDMVWNVAYLIEEEALDEFRRALAALEEESAAHGFSYELTGPWPPYHFVTRAREGIADAARC